MVGTSKRIKAKAVPSGEPNGTATSRHEWPVPQSRASGLQNGIFLVHSQNHPQQEKRAMGRKETLSSNMHASISTNITTVKRSQAADNAKAAKFPFDFRANGNSWGYIQKRTCWVGVIFSWSELFWNRFVVKCVLVIQFDRFFFEICLVLALTGPLNNITF